MKHKLDYAELLCRGHVVAVEDSEGNNGPDTCIGDSIFLYRIHQAKVVVMQWLRRLMLFSVTNSVFLASVYIGLFVCRFVQEPSTCHSSCHRSLLWIFGFKTQSLCKR